MALTTQRRWRHARAAGRSTSLTALCLLVLGCDVHPTTHVGRYSRGKGHPAEKSFPVPPPPFSEGIYPCMECHADLELNPKRRKLTDEHTKIKLEHGTRRRWCFDCHDAKDRNKLRLAGGTLIPFSRSYLLCGQCHGPKLRDWRVGVHGKRTGLWNGKKRYLLCAHCHNPHSPRFKSIKPAPPPQRPENVQ